MAVTPATLVAAKIVEATQTTQYTSTNVTTIIDKFTVTNYSAITVTISVNLVPSNDTPSNSNLIVKTRSIAPSATATFSELVGQILMSGTFVSTLASTASSLNMRVSGRQIS
jgi:hypothetical protein